MYWRVLSSRCLAVSRQRYIGEVLDLCEPWNQRVRHAEPESGDRQAQELELQARQEAEGVRSASMPAYQSASEAVS
jgi:hypothetical protein